MSGLFTGLLEVNDLNVTGTTTYTGPVLITGSLNVVGNVDATTVGTNILRDNAAVTDTQIVMQSNAGANDYFDIQRVDGLHVNSITSSSAATNLELSASSNIVQIPIGDQLNVDTVRSNAGQVLDLVSNGAVDISLTSGSSLIQVGASALNGNSFLLSSGANQFSPKVDNAFNLGTALLRFANLYLGTGLTLPTSGGTASVLNYYEEFDTTLATAGAIVSNINVHFIRIGKHVTFQWEDLVTGSAANATLTFNLPDARFFPVANMNEGAIGQDNAASAELTMSIQSTGQVSVGVGITSAAFTGAAAAALYGGFMCWVVA